MRSALFVAFLASALFAAAPGRAQPADAPSRVGRVASVSGAVSFHLAGAERWERASINLPLTDGSALWTQPGGAATIGFSGNRIALDAATELDLDRLDDHSLTATQPQGASYWRLLSLPDGGSASLQTPRGIVAFAGVGRYEVVSGDTEHPTEITVLEGSAKVTGLSSDVVVGPNQTLSITGDGGAVPFAPTLRATVRDAFLQRMLAAERPPARHVALPPSVALMTGSEILAEQGDWSESPDYGPVWYPPAPAGFVPYRDGHWAYVAPWGWTWVDDAPWGFAPTHYGRWTEIGGRWGWVPGREWAPERPPVYAPALVAFVGGAVAGSWVGWAPLGPRDAYRPAYQVSPRYVEALNRPTGAVTNVTVINRQAMTVVPVQAMASSVNVARAFRAAPPASAAPEAVQFRAPVMPTRATVGVTPAVLREVAPHEAEGPVRPGAPGPAIGPAGGPHVGAAALLGGAAAGGAAAALLRPSAPRAGLPELRPHGVLRSAVPGAPFTPPGAAPPAGPMMPQAPRAQAVPPPERFAPRPMQPALAQPEPRAPFRPEQARPAPDMHRPEMIRPEMARPEMARPEVARPEMVRPGMRPEMRPEAPRVEMRRQEIHQPEMRVPQPARIEAPRAPPPHVEPRPAPVARPEPVHQAPPQPHQPPPRHEENDRRRP